MDVSSWSRYLTTSGLAMFPPSIRRMMLSDWNVRSYLSKRTPWGVPLSRYVPDPVSMVTAVIPKSDTAMASSITIAISFGRATTTFAIDSNTAMVVLPVLLPVVKNGYSGPFTHWRPVFFS